MRFTEVLASVFLGIFFLVLFAPKCPYISPLNMRGVWEISYNEDVGNAPNEFVISNDTTDGKFIGHAEYKGILVTVEGYTTPERKVFIYLKSENELLGQYCGTMDSMGRINGFFLLNDAILLREWNARRW